MHRTGSRALIIALTLVIGATVPAMAQSMSNDKAMADKNMAMANDKMMMGPKGTFTGSKDHAASGSYSISGSGKDRKLELSDNFKVDKAPDIYVILSNGATAKDAGSLSLGRLKKLDGAQSYKIPESADLAGYDSVLLWCKKYSVLMAQAPLANAAMGHDAMGSMDHGSMDKPTMAKDTGMMKPMAKDTGMMKKP